MAELDSRVFRDLSYGLYIVTSKENEKINGQIVNTVIQVTSDPPRVAVIINKNNLTHEFIMNSKVLAAMVLDENVPILIPEVNPEHIQLIETQLKKRNGFIVTNPNCSTTGLAIALKPLTKFKIRKVIVSTYQALSGAGYPGVPSPTATTYVSQWVALTRLSTAPAVNNALPLWP